MTVSTQPTDEEHYEGPSQSFTSVNPAEILMSHETEASPMEAGVAAEDETGAKSANKEASASYYTTIPLARVKKIMKEEPDMEKLSADAVFCMTLAVESFLAYFVRHAFQYSKKDKRKTLAYKDLVHVVKELGQFEFLEDIIPLPIAIQKALEEREKVLGPAKDEPEVEEQPENTVAEPEAEKLETEHDQMAVDEPAEA